MTLLRLAYVNIFARDIEALSSFYAQVLGLPEIEGHRSPIYRCLDAGGTELGFNAPAAYALLGAESRADGAGALRVYPTFEADSLETVDRIALKAQDAGGRIVKPPYDTYYNARQCVLEDPEGNLFRINHRKGRRLPSAEVENPPWA